MMLLAGEDLAEALTRERSARLAAEAACRKKEEFIAAFSHELGTPLASAIVAATLIERLSPADPRAVTARHVLGRQLDQARRLVEDLLDLERVTTGTLELAAERVEVAQLARDSVAAIIVPTHEIRIEASPAWVVGDPHRLRQIIGNLITNAIKHTPAGGHLSLRVFHDDGAVVHRVDDTGRGMPADLVRRVLDALAQGEAPGGQPSRLGLGLSVVRILVELHGGRVEALSEGLGRGSSFIVRLPAAPTL